MISMTGEVWVTVITERWNDEDEQQGGALYAFEQANVRSQGLMLEGMLAAGLRHRQQIDASYVAAQATIPSLVRLDVDGRTNSPWN